MIRRIHYVVAAEEAQKSVKGVPDNLVHTKYVELVWSSPPNLHKVQSRSSSTTLQFAEFKRLERDHAKEKQKLIKDKDAG